MKEDEFRNYLQKRKLKAEDIDFAVCMAKEFEQYLEKNNRTLESAELDSLIDYISLMIKEGKNTWDRLVAIARFCYHAKKNDFYIYFTSVLGARNVLPDMGERVANIAGEKVKSRIFQDFKLPPLGAPQENYPKLTKTIMDRMESELPIETCKQILTWNYHKIPAEAFKQKKERFENASTIDEWLKIEHEKLVEELSKSMKEGRTWYEQEITPEVLKFVSDNQEISTGARQDDTIFVTKIPYAPKEYLKEEDPALKRFYACHCPLVRTAIRERRPEISPTFCYCSGGFTKFGFDQVFGEPVKIELLESVLKGDTKCRFAIKIPKTK
ncbi:MAG: hypothetical protein PVF96_03265 [Candidatus Bathyarchaeota archaeon]